MPVSNGRFSKPIRLKEDLANFFGLPANLGYIIKNADINIFARFKPVEVPNKVSPITEQDRENAGHGITSPDTVLSITLTKDAIIDASANEWGYIRPSTKFRALDFDGYDHYAVPPIQCVYPTNGWEVNNTENSTLRIYFDLDPGDSYYNLQAYDIIKNIDLRKCYIYAVLCKYDDTQIGIYDSGETILDSSGELNSPVIYIPITGLSQMDPNFRYRIYMCLGYFESGKYNLIPLPRSGTYNPQIMYLNVISDPFEGGGGIENPDADISFAPSFNSDYYEAGECTDEGGGRWVMRNTTGELLVQMSIYNSSENSKILYLKDFNAVNYFSGNVSKYPNYVFENKPASTAGGVQSFIVPPSTKKTVWLYFDTLLNNVTSTNINELVEIDIQRNGYTIWNGALNYCKGTLGWTYK